MLWLIFIFSIFIIISNILLIYILINKIILLSTIIAQKNTLLQQLTKEFDEYKNIYITLDEIILSSSNKGFLISDLMEFIF